MAKQRGRKRVNDLYFGPEEEEAVVVKTWEQIKEFF